MGGAPKQEMLNVNGSKYYLQIFFPISNTVKPNVLERTEDKLLKKSILIIGIINNCDLCANARDGKIYLYNDVELCFLANDIMKLFSYSYGELLPEPEKISQIASSGDIDRLKQFVLDGNNIDQKTSQGETVITIAAMGSDMDMVKACIAVGASTSGLLGALRKVANYEFITELKDEGIL
ncbi:ankyrin repeat domain-containing protein [Cerasicoccus fimbriatus]|uniref:ankyrin repeat domain-containing protein n=1 Tax=Cerasicoccus fimbriatus TaxID=3014554 RepID=UPI0022B3E5C5|nr:ankyrin repeat domain-containing protein [Cerasicoccus sp. TK19100]